MTILFDLDGTLIDSTEAILESFHNSFDIFKMPHPSDEAIQSLIGHPLEVMYERLGVEQDMILEIVAIYKEHYRQISTQKTELLPFATEAIALAAAHARLGIVTTKTGKYSKVLMEHFSLMHYFEVLIGREDVQNPKPHPEPIQKAIEYLKVSKEDCWMIGDTTMDLMAAREAGIRSVGVQGPYEPLEELRKYTNIIKSNPLEAVQTILK